MAQTTSFTAPGYDYGVELGQIDRRRALAQALQSQSMQPTQQQTAGGWVLPNSPTEGLAKLAQAFASNRQQKKADEKQTSLNSKVQGDYQNMLARGISQLQGTSSSTIQPDPQEAQQSADQGTPQVGTVNQPAQAPNPMAALQTFGSHPMGAQFAPLAMQEMQRQRLAEALRGGPPQSQAQNTPAQPNAPTQLAGPVPDGGIASMQPAGMPQGASPQPIGQPQQAPTGGPAGGIPMEAWLQQDPSGKTYLEQLAKDYAEGQKPVINRGFGLGRMVNGRYVADPASENQALSLKRGEADISSAHELVPVQGPNGTQYIPKSQLIGASNPLPAKVPESDRAAYEAVASGKVPAAYGNRPENSSGQGSEKPFSNIPTLGQGGFSQELSKREADRVSTMIGDIQDKATHAVDKVAQNNKMIEMIPQIATGPLNKQVTVIKNLAKEMGVDIGDPTPNQEFEKYAIQGALATAKQIYGSRITNQDVSTQIMSNPGATITEKAIYQLLQYDNQIQQRHLQKATAYDEYTGKNGDPRKFSLWFAQNYPFQGVSAPQTGGSQSFQVPTATPQQAKSSVRKYNPATGRIE